MSQDLSHRMEPSTDTTTTLQTYVEHFNITTAKIILDPEESSTSEHLINSSIHCKSLIWEYDGCPVLLIVPLAKLIDKTQLSVYLNTGVDVINLAKREQARRLSGFEIGTIPPIGLAHPLRTIIDSSVLNEDTISKSNASNIFIRGGSGRVNYSLYIALSDVIRVSSAEIASICASYHDEIGSSPPSASVEVSVPRGLISPVFDANSNDEQTVLINSPTVLLEPDIRQLLQAKPAVIEMKKNERRTKWAAANKSLLFQKYSKNNGQTFSAKLLRDYAWLEESSLFYKMLSHYDESYQTIANESSERIDMTVEMLRAELDNATSTGKTALHLASWKGPIGHVKSLLSRGADINKYSTSTGNYGKTALFYAITQCRDDVVIELVKSGANVKIINNKGQSPLSLAVSHLLDDAINLIEQAEIESCDSPWINFRAERSDGRMYGDLDPRFLDEINGNDENPFAQVTSEFVNSPPHIFSRQVTIDEKYWRFLSPCGRSLYPTTRATRRILQRSRCVPNGKLEAYPQFQRSLSVDGQEQFQFEQRPPVNEGTGQTQCISQECATAIKSRTMYCTVPLMLKNLRNYSDCGMSALNAVPQFLTVVGVIISKRHISKGLVFINVIPQCSEATLNYVRKGSSEEKTSTNGDLSAQETLNSTSAVSFEKYAWSIKDVSSTDGNDLQFVVKGDSFEKENGEKLFALQLIIGKTLREAIGLELVVTLCKTLKFGQLIRATGTVVIDSEKGAENLNVNHTIDMVVSHIKVLQDNFIETEFLKSATFIEKGELSRTNTTFVDVTCKGSESFLLPSNTESTSVALEPQITQDFVSNKLDNLHLNFTQSDIGRSLNMSEESTEAPVLSLQNIYGTLASEPMCVHVVDTLEAVKKFALFVRTLVTSSSTIESLDENYPMQNVVGVDCEWCPNRADSDEVAVGDNPVETLQLGFYNQTFILDLRALCSPHANFHVRHILSDIESRICVALGELFSHHRILIVGFSVLQDLRKLAGSYPHLLCFHRFNTVLDLSTLATQLMGVKGTAYSLSALCEKLLQKRLDKSQQCSTWDLRPLTEAQINYAALDAAVLTRLYKNIEVFIQNNTLQNYHRLSNIVVNYKFTHLYQKGSSLGVLAEKLGLEHYSEYEYWKFDDPIQRAKKLEYQIMEDLLQRTITEGKIRRELDSIFAIQSWTSAFNPLARLVAGSRNKLENSIRSNRKTEQNVLKNMKEPPSPILNSQQRHFKLNNDLIQTRSLPAVNRRMNRGRSNSNSLSNSASAVEEFSQEAEGHLSVPAKISTSRLSSSIGEFVGKSKYACVQFCLKALTFATTPYSSGSKYNCDSVNSNAEVPTATTSNIEMSEATLQMIESDTLRRLNSNGGWIEFFNSLILFVNCIDPNGTNKAPLQYGNEFLHGGRYFTWFIDEKRWQANKSRIAQMILSTKVFVTDIVRISDYSDEQCKYESDGSVVLLFARKGISQYIYCGRCRLVLHEPPSSRQKLVKLTYELLDFDNEKCGLTQDFRESELAGKCLLQSPQFLDMIESYVTK